MSVRFDRPVDHLAVITIDRYERRNAFDTATALALEAALDAYDADQSLWCAILTGAGGVFSAGQDLKALEDEGIASGRHRGFFGLLEVPPTKPLIAAVEGHALAGGLELCLACDLVVASRTATMGLPEAARSLVAVGGGLFRLPKRIPYHLAMELALTGTPWPATRLAELGLVNRLAEPGSALAAAVDLASDVLAAGPLAVAATTRIVRRAHDWSDRDGWARQGEHVDALQGSDDQREGLAAFAEKRPPRWRGR